MQKKIVVIGLTGALVLTFAGLAWFQRTPLLTWFYVRGLAKAEEQDRQTWVNRVAAFEGEAVPQLIACLRQADAKACANAEAGLTEIVNHWRADDARRVDLATHLTEAFSGFSPPGLAATLQLQTILLRTSTRELILPAAIRFLADAARQTDREVHRRALLLATEMQQTMTGEAFHACRDLIRTCLHDE